MKPKRKAPAVAATTIGSQEKQTSDLNLTLLPLPKQARPDARFGAKPHKTLHRSPEGFVLVTWPQGRVRWAGSTLPEAHRTARELQKQDKLPIDWEGAL